ncbi:hypothetical protein CTAYLR_002732 [Chrysophaeum taylorii]|uniref:Fringe-like glycosyltransferase domain-containing protein n=1 Tax=Chrysophaeum taylorii TaxID=2483200 RepID=A0AAD7UC15_9STRA|nr:hypothetical protein CTAYLR_002732 [Chrysophaeum taylorii]
MHHLNASAVSIIVLSTSLVKENKATRPKYSYFFDRAVPLKRTWAREFEVELAFGTNIFDSTFLAEHCEELKKRRRELRIVHPQVPPRNVMETFECEASLRVLYFANCTGEYMGLGPVCRCQESIRYWLQSPRFEKTKWFVFIDDDVYFRPQALLALLAGFDESRPLGFVGAHGPRGLSLTRDRWKRCGDICAFRFPWAQPAILSKGAIERMRTFVDRDYMTESQKTWFGTHDVILGLALWWASIPLFSLSDFSLYHHGPRKIKPQLNPKHQKSPRNKRRRLLVDVTHNERVHLAAHLDATNGIMQHGVRGEAAGDLSSHKLFEALDDNNKDNQTTVGVNLRHKLLMYKNDGALHITGDQGPAHRLFLDPNVCQGDTPARILDSAANRDPTNLCTFNMDVPGDSPLRYGGGHS